MVKEKEFIDICNSLGLSVIIVKKNNRRSNTLIIFNKDKEIIYEHKQENNIEKFKNKNFIKFLCNFFNQC